MLSITAPIFKLFLLLLLEKTPCCCPALHLQNNQLKVFKYSGNYHRESRNPKFKPCIRGGIFYVEDSICTEWEYFIKNNNDWNSRHPGTTQEFKSNSLNRSVWRKKWGVERINGVKNISQHSWGGFKFSESNPEGWLSRCFDWDALILHNLFL